MSNDLPGIECHRFRCRWQSTGLLCWVNLWVFKQVALHTAVESFRWELHYPNPRTIVEMDVGEARSMAEARINAAAALVGTCGARGVALSRYTVQKIQRFAALAVLEGR